MVSHRLILLGFVFHMPHKFSFVISTHGSLYKSVALCLRDSELRMITVSSQSRAILKRSKQPILPVSTDDSGRASLLASLFEDLIVGSSITGLFCCRRISATSCRRSHTAQLRGTLALLVEAAGARTSPLDDIWTSPQKILRRASLGERNTPPHLYQCLEHNTVVIIMN